MSGRLPLPGDRVSVSTTGAQAYGTLVGEHDGPLLAVFAPPDLPVAELPTRGSVVVVRWDNARGRHWVESTLVSTSTEGDLLWLLELADEVHSSQDRRYARGGGGEPVTLQCLTPSAPVVHGTVVDVSERSIRARCGTVELEEGDPLAILLVLEDCALEVAGSVQRVLERDDDGTTDVVALFEPTEPQAAQIRRYVFASQRRQRDQRSFR